MNGLSSDTPPDGAPASLISSDSTYPCNSDCQNLCYCHYDEYYSHKCAFTGRHVEPLAWTLDTSLVHPQDTSPLYTIVPSEIRELIYVMALSEHDLYPKDDSNPTLSAIALPLLQTCKRVYIETYKLPISLNSQRFSRPDSECDLLHTISPWQFGMITRVNLKLSQDELEGSGIMRAKGFREWVEELRPKERQSGAVVAPTFHIYQSGVDPHLIDSFGFRLLLEENASFTFTGTHTADTSEIVLATYCARHLSSTPLRRTRSMAIKAKPLTHLRLSITRGLWRLTLDPAFNTHPFGGHGSLNNPVVQLHRPLMLWAAEMRRQGLFMNPDANPLLKDLETGWGDHIGSISSLQVLELVLETYADRKEELETVIDCAKTWVFPLRDTPYALIWDGQVENGSYQDNSELDRARSRVLQGIFLWPGLPPVV